MPEISTGRPQPMRRVLPLILAALAGAAGAQEVYRCTLPDGSTSFQDTPCDAQAGQRGGRIEVPPINSFEVPANEQVVLRRWAEERNRPARHHWRHRHDRWDDVRRWDR
jgi:hypothetical protein